MKNKLALIKYSLLLFLFALISCEKEIQYKGEGKDPVLVLNGINENDSIFRIYLERSYFFLSNESQSDKYIKTGATVTLTNLSSGEIFTMTNSSLDNKYEFPFVTSQNVKFKIEVSHPDYESISAEMTTVPKINLNAVDTSTFESNNGTRKKAVLKWNDPVGKNFYFVKVSVFNPEGAYTNMQYFSCLDPVFEDGGSSIVGESEYPEIYFTDELFDGNEKTLEIDFYSYKTDSIQNAPIYTYSLISMNKETYQYFISVKKASNVGFFTEPVKVFSNINNGFGIFGSMNFSNIVK